MDDLRHYTKPPKWAEDDVKGMFLFGSRSMAARKSKTFSMGKIRTRIEDTTDFDYAAPFDEVRKKKLIENGWNEIEVTELYHPCRLLKALLVKKQADQNVQILMRTDHYIFEKAWNSIDLDFWFKYIWKSSPEFKFKNLETKERKEIISRYIQQLYDTIEYVYGGK